MRGLDRPTTMLHGLYVLANRWLALLGWRRLAWLPHLGSVSLALPTSATSNNPSSFSRRGADTARDGAEELAICETVTETLASAVGLPDTFPEVCIGTKQAF